MSTQSHNNDKNVLLTHLHRDRNFTKLNQVNVFVLCMNDSQVLAQES